MVLPNNKNIVPTAGQVGRAGRGEDLRGTDDEHSRWTRSDGRIRPRGRARRGGRGDARDLRLAAGCRGYAFRARRPPRRTRGSRGGLHRVSSTATSSPSRVAAYEAALVLAREDRGRRRRCLDAAKGRRARRGRSRRGYSKVSESSTTTSRWRPGTAASRCILYRWWPSDHGGRNRLDHESRPWCAGAARRQGGPAHVPLR